MNSSFTYILRIILLFWLLFSCVGCSLPHTRNIGPSDPAVSQDQSVFWKIRFFRWSKPLFSGLLGIKFEQRSLQYVLLDGSGITLARAQVDRSGKISNQSGIARIIDSGLPNYLGSALSKIYFLEPANMPCSHTFFFKLCKERGKNDIVKSLTSGPFTLYTIKYLSRVADSPAAIRFSQPWYGVRIEFNDVEQPDTQQ